MGIRYTAEGVKAGLPDGLAAMRMHLGLMEEWLLGDGREFVGDVSTPGLADVHLGWAFDWMLEPPELMGMKHAYPELLNGKRCPKVFQWIERIRKAVEEARERLGPLKVVSDDEVVKMTEDSGYFETNWVGIDDTDPTGLRKGEEIDIYPTDMASGFVHRDSGKQVELTVNGVTVETPTKNGPEVRIYYPRQNIRVTKAISR